MKVQAMAAAIAVVAAVALPQIIHVAGAALGVGSGLGEMLLPMHLPVLLVGFLAGPWAGLVSGFLAPLVSFGLTGMPGQAMLPFIVIELCIYGLTAGFLRAKTMPVLGKVIVAQCAGRLVRAGAILLAVPVLGISAVPVSVIWTSITAGICGLIL
ncbi:MAG: ECF transporter S component [Ruminiclostridium sp.]|nr:ECF transporter S component [Ruminiclostridium sp.]